VPSLSALCGYPGAVIAVLTQPDRPAGRGRRITASPVKETALGLGVPVLQPRSLKTREAHTMLAGLDLDLLVVVAYGLILPQWVLELPRYGCINVHASLLPRWRGAAPIQRALMAGDRETGISIMQMDEGLDTGDVLYQVSVDIRDDDTGGSLHDRLAALGAQALTRVLDQLRRNDLSPVRQDDALACYADKIDKSECRLSWRESAIALERKVRAFNPWPVAETRLEDRRIRIWDAAAVGNTGGAQPGRVVAVGPGGIDVCTGAGVLRLLRLQLPGKRPLAAAQIINSVEFTGGVFR
jgi:methionyl-tRNA formyltransferase